MKRSHLAILVLSLLCLILAACGGTPPSTAKTATPIPTTQTVTSMGQQEIKITIGDFYIHSPVTTFTAGTKYRLTVTNVGTHHHDFFIMHPMQTMTMTMDDVYKRAQTYIYNIGPNETRVLTLTFRHTAPPGMLEFSCHYGGHYEAGMHQAIVINAAPGTVVSPYPNNGIPSSANSQASTGPCDPLITTKIANNAYTPASVSLKKGDTLTITNTDSQPYILIITPYAGISATTVGPNKAANITFPNAGTFTISTLQHPQAKATISVSTTAGSTCGMTPVAIVSFDANYTNPKHHYFFTPTQVTMKKGQRITLSNLADQDLSFTSTPDADLGNLRIFKNDHRDLTFTTEGTYTISCTQFPTEKFTVTVHAT